IDADVQRSLTGWLAAAGIESRAYAHVGAFLRVHPADLPGCLVIDAQQRAVSGLELQAMILPLATRYPIVMAVPHATAGIAIRPLQQGAVNLVEKPLREPEVVAAVGAAIEFDRQQRLIAACRAELRARFARLTVRECQVMALVTSGMLNKQVAM